MGSTDSELDSIFQDNKRHRNRLVPIGTFLKNPNFTYFFLFFFFAVLDRLKQLNFVFHCDVVCISM